MDSSYPLFLLLQYVKIPADIFIVKYMDIGDVILSIYYLLLCINFTTLTTISLEKLVMFAVTWKK